MRIQYDAEVDALSIVFLDTTVTTTELAEGITAEYDQAGRLVGLEVLDVAKRLGDASLLREVTLEGVGIGAGAPRDVPPSPIESPGQDATPIENAPQHRDRRMQWAQASRDPDFLRDIAEVEAAFRAADAESLRTRRQG